VPPRSALIGLLTGLALVVVAVVLWPAGAGSSPAPADAAPAAPVAAAQAAPQPAASAPPARLWVGGVAGAVPVVPVGVDERGAMAVPEDVRTVGWYRYGPRPGASSGSSVLSGHVDDRVQGRGAFADLGEVEPGDPVEVELADGTRLAYRVRTIERIAKDQLAVDRLFTRSGPPRITLVTCGGDFDRTTRTYEENVVVTAER
jgi:LPXTG-site transpeptidase (sortase) family protein